MLHLYFNADEMKQLQQKGNYHFALGHIYCLSHADSKGNMLCETNYKFAIELSGET